MDEKTAELRDLFVETTGEETVTESQSTPRGSLSADRDDAVDERLADLIAAMRDRYEFVSSLSPADLRRIVRGFFDPDAAGADAESWSDAADAALADSLSADADAETVFHARMDLHLVTEFDREAPVRYERLRRAVLAASDDSGGEIDESLAAALDTDPDAETVRHYRRVVAADLASRGVNHRFRDGFADLLTDADLSSRLAADARRDGLEEATEDIETDVSL
ncbi:conditioned medium-induced protein 4 [Halobellus ordinarius]|uniref:conditioned medium-induced protein 4 n=1 Tax=Halobellus ordinarius TaxID=3075120 RepID=UPI002880799E|nr:conditioned medium-induced protein 4 [Halobellus sp. ZY16]